MVKSSLTPKHKRRTRNGETLPAGPQPSPPGSTTRAPGRAEAAAPAARNPLGQHHRACPLLLVERQALQQKAVSEPEKPSAKC